MLTLLIYFSSLPSYAQTPTVAKVRSLYAQTEKQENACKELIDILGPYNETNNPLFLGYKSSATMMMAKYVSNPFSKLSYFNRGKKMLEKAVNADKYNIELRSLRFLVQSNVPSFLGYNDDIDVDKTFIISNAHLVQDPELKKNIVYFMNRWGKLTPNQKNILNK
ncbi:MAG: hypothetical protein ABI266_06750 [Ginsengibacter sp.]